MLAFQRQQNCPSDESLMAHSCASTLRAVLGRVTEYYNKFSNLANCHLVNFITEDLWQTCLPDDIRQELELIGLEPANTLLWNLPAVSAKDATSWAPCLTKYILESKGVSLGSLTEQCIPYANLKKKLLCESTSKTLPQLNQFMSPKKAHEVEIMSELVATLATVSKASHIVDVGSGKGYLTSMLALHHGLYILGVDSSPTNTHGAAERTQKLEKAWFPAIKKQNELQTGQCSFHHGKHWKTKIKTTTSSSQQQKLSIDGNCKCCGDVFSLYKQVTAFISEDTDLTTLVTEHFSNQHTCSSILLTGLHTCGNLGPSCLRLFAKDNSVSALCNVGCCHHLLEEKFYDDPFSHNFPYCNEKKPCDGFPMSNFLTEKKFILGRNARMLSSQSLHRILSKKEAPNDSLWYRALLQVLLVKKLEGKANEAQVGRIGAKCQSFTEYVSKAFNKLGLTLEVTSDEIEDLCKSYKSYQEKLPVFFMFRASLAPVIETIILLDRLLYLYEQGITDAHLVQLFDPVVSPRCFALVAMK